MNIVEINTCDYGSTGKIMLQLAEEAKARGHNCWIALPKGRHNNKKKYNNTIWIGNRFSEDVHLALGRLFGLQGFFSLFATYSFVKKLDKVKPDIIHIHNLHNSYINIPILFSYIKKNKVRVVWTFHDCWPFTGHCPHFTLSACEKWKTGCHNCPSIREYPTSFVDNSKWMWRRKKKWFNGVKDMVIITPSVWLAGLVKESFFKEYPVQVINNGIDLNIYKPRKSNFKYKHCLEGKFIILGVAFDWGYRKGLDTFIKLSRCLDDEYKIVLVGTNKDIERTLPKEILSINKTSDQIELAEIYSGADVLLNPTREDNYPTVNMEAIACGTPVITYNTGGSPEIVIDANCGKVLDNTDLDILCSTIEKMRTEIALYDCKEYACEFDKKKMISQYIRVYEEVL